MIIAMELKYDKVCNEKDTEFIKGQFSEEMLF